jgi:CheY-like chemotaxis protein
MSRLVNDLLDVGRITQGQLRLELSTVSLSEVLEQALEQSRPLIDQMAHSLTVSLPSRNVKVRADRVRLAQVFANLLHNAAKYTPNGGSVTVRTEVAESTVTVTIQDTGSGIPLDMLGSIFDLFTQLPRSLARSDGGLGIGLTLVKRLTEMHGGSVSASSQGPGHGAEFKVVLGLAGSDEAESRRAPHAGPGAVRNGCNVLLVDDNEDANLSLGPLLEEAGHRIAYAADGFAGLEAARSLQFDAVLLDIGLPGIDGYEVVRQLRADPATRHMHVIALTGYGQGMDVQRAREAGFDHHLLKPAQVDDILGLLAAVAGRQLH